MIRSYLLLTSLIFFSCSVPISSIRNNVVPDMPSSFATAGITWKKQSPARVYENSNWWRVFHDSELNQITSATLAQNLSLAAASSRLDEARAMSRATRGTLFPSLDFNGSASRSQFRFLGPSGGSIKNDSFSLPLDLAYEVDAWGKIKHQISAAHAREAGAQATIIAAKLSLTAEAAQTYFAIRSLDADAEILNQGMKLRKEVLAIIESRVQAGTINALDLNKAKSEIATAESECLDNQKKRVELEHALQTLTNSQVSSVSKNAKLQSPPHIPSGVPADLLLRRPDLLITQKNVEAANADIGVVEAAFYPSLKFRASGGLESGSLSNLFSVDQKVWSLGVSVNYPILAQRTFLKHQHQAAIARHKTATYEYQQAALTALQETNNALTATGLLEKQEWALQAAVKSAQESVDIAMTRFEGGLIQFLDVADAQRSLLSAQRQAAAVKAERLATSVQLIKALGGSW